MKGFEKIGATINQGFGKIVCEAKEIKPAEVNLDFPSVGATENIMLAAVLSEGTTKIINAAMEPEIVDLQNFLNKMGAKIEGAGSNIIKIQGVKKLKDVSYNIMPDRIEAGTLLCAAAVTGGEIKLKKVNVLHIAPILNKLTEAGCTIKLKENEINLKAPKRLKAIDIKTMPYPGFPTDMQAIMGGILVLANGTSVIVENIFENRYKYIQELKKMGAKVNVEGKTAVIKGVKRLYGSKVMATDLRGGASLVLAGLAAKGTTNVENIEYILRGYENLELKLKNLGAEIYLVKE